jgi:predicted ABC-type ATPase
VKHRGIVAEYQYLIPDDIIRRRFNTRFDALKRVLLLCDFADFHDNTTEFRLLAEYSNNSIINSAPYSF